MQGTEKKSIGFLFFRTSNIKRNYGVQAINLSLIEKLKPRFNNPTFTMFFDGVAREEDTLFAKKHDIMIFEARGFFNVPKSADFFDSYLFKRILKNKTKIEEPNRFIDPFRKFNVILDNEGIEYTGGWSSYVKASHIQLLAKDYEIKYLKYTKSYGPFKREMHPSKFIHNHQVRKRLNELPFLMVRGNFNLEEIKKLNLKIPIYSFPDVSLSMEPESESWARSFLSEKGIDLSTTLIGISPTFVIGSLPATPENTCGANHILLCKKMIDAFRKKKYNVLIIPHSLYDGKNERVCDLALSKKIYSELKETENVYVLEDMNLTYKQVRAIIGLLDFYMTGRYHATCSALYMGVPTICFSWHIKYKDVMSLFLDDYLVLDSRQTNVNDSVERILKYYNDQSWFNKEDVLRRRKDVNVEIDKSIDLLVGEIKKQLGT